LEHEVLREALSITLDLLVQALDLHAIQFRQLRIQNNSHAPEEQNLWLDWSDRHHVLNPHKISKLLEVVFCDLKRNCQSSDSKGVSGSEKQKAR
jgi:hypothetical protein